jgi:predicted NBD/HSP70 family sugar kinase
MEHGTADSLARVLSALIETPGLTRAELGLRVGLTRAPVGMALGVLAERGFIEQRVESDRPLKGRVTGRPPLRIHLAGDAGYSIALDVGKTALSGGLFDLTGRELHAESVDGGRAAGPAAVLDAAEAMVQRLLGGAGVKRAHVSGVGVGLAAPIDRDGTVVADGSDDRWGGYTLGTELARRVDIRVDVDNDANAGALGEHRFGAGRGSVDMLYLRLSDGVGVGLIVNGRVYRGAGGVAGELGHTPVNALGALCSCGNRGCLETVASSRAVVEDVYGRASGRGIDDVIRAAAAGDRRAQRAIADAGSTVGAALAGAVNLMNPSRVVVGGDLAAAGDLLLTPLQEALERHVLPAACANTLVTAGELGHRAELLGAASLHLPHLAGALIRRLATA